MERVAAGLQQTYRHEIVEFCHMSMLGPHFPETFEKCVAKGATEVLVMPYFLHVGQHMRADIPNILRESIRKHPQVSVVLGRNLGFDPVLIDLMEKRVAESAGLPDIRELPEVHEDDHACAQECPHGAKA
jgi:sirohydrochlorin ferrochelatase